MSAAVHAHAAAESERFRSLIQAAARLWAAKHDSADIASTLGVDQSWVANNLYRIRLEASETGK